MPPTQSRLGLYRWAQDTAIPAAFDGFDTTAAPEYIANTKGRVVDNCLVDRKGKLPMRGPVYSMYPIADTGYVANLGGVAGVWHYNDSVLINTGHTTTAFRYPGGGTVAIGSRLYFANLGTAPNTYNDLGASFVCGPSYTRNGNYVYGISWSSSDAALVSNGYSINSTFISRWDGLSGIPTKYVNAPRGCLDIHTYAERTFVAGGTPADDPMNQAKWNGNVLYYSDVGGTPVDAATAWQDDVSGLTNQIVIAENNPSDNIVALANIESGLAIFKRDSIHVLRGSGPSNFSVKTFASNVGAISKESVSEFQDGVLFLSTQGLMFFDGSQLVNLGDAVQSELLPYLDPTNRGSYTFNITQMANGYAHVSVRAKDSDVASWSGELHVPSRSWTRFTFNDSLIGGTITNHSAPGWCGRTTSYTIAIWGARLVFMDHMFGPEGATTAQGTDHCIYQGLDIARRINARWYSRLIRVGPSLLKGQIHRLQVSYTWKQPSETTETALDGWYFTVLSGTGDVILPEQQLQAQDDPSQYEFMRRQQFDLFTKEVTDFQIRMEWKHPNGATTSAPIITDAEIYDVTVQYEVHAETRYSG